MESASFSYWHPAASYGSLMVGRLFSASTLVIVLFMGNSLSILGFRQTSWIYYSVSLLIIILLLCCSPLALRARYQNLYLVLVVKRAKVSISQSSLVYH